MSPVAVAVTRYHYSRRKRERKVGGTDAIKEFFLLLLLFMTCFFGPREEKSLAKKEAEGQRFANFFKTERT